MANSAAEYNAEPCFGREEARYRSPTPPMDWSSARVGFPLVQQVEGKISTRIAQDERQHCSGSPIHRSPLIARRTAFKYSVPSFAVGVKYPPSPFSFQA